jgi:hypothetical protein
LQVYHQEDADVSGWLDFFFDGVAIIAAEAIETSKKINLLRQQDVV